MEKVLHIQGKHLHFTNRLLLHSWKEPNNVARFCCQWNFSINIHLIFFLQSYFHGVFKRSVGPVLVCLFCSVYVEREAFNIFIEHMEKVLPIQGKHLQYQSTTTHSWKESNNAARFSCQWNFSWNTHLIFVFLREIFMYLSKDLLVQFWFA